MSAGKVDSAAWDRVTRAVRKLENQPRRLVPERRRRSVPGGGRCPCPVQIEFYTEGGPTSGAFTWRFAGSASNDLVINFDDTTAEVVTAMNALPLFDGVTAVTPSATALPASSVIVQLPAGEALPSINPVGNTLDDGRMKVRYRP